MKEEIKKEIRILPHYSEYMQNINGGHWNIETVSVESVYKILDKYKDKEDKYKNAWEELKDWFNAPIMRDTVVYGRLEWTDINYKIQELEQKHNISKVIK